MGHVKQTDEHTPWAKRNGYQRKSIETRKIKSTFLIICEGASTEPTYFGSFPVNSETKVEAFGIGRSKTSLVNSILRYCSDRHYLLGQSEYDNDRQIWCVFDKDEKGIKGEDEDYNTAITNANKNRLKVAYSNDSFELWLILHDKYLDVKHSRTQYYEYLSRELGINYVKKGKSKEVATNLYNHYLSKQQIAIKNSEKLHAIHKHLPFCRQNPCTTIHLLVKELNKCIKK